MLRSRLPLLPLLALALALAPVAACLGDPSDGEDADQKAQNLDQTTIDMAAYMIPDCDHAGAAWQMGAEQFRTVPMGVTGGRGRFVIVKSADGSGYEEWSVDKDWMRLRADTTWAYELPDHTWCDVKCGTNDGGNCQQRWNHDPNDPKNGNTPSAPWVYTLYSDPADAGLGAPITPRKMALPVGGSHKFSSSIVIRGQERGTCVDCAVNFDSKGQAVGRSVTARRYASWHGFEDVVHLHIDSGPGAGEDAYFARGVGWVGFNSGVVSGSVPSSTLPQMLCSAAQQASICSVTGASSAPPSPPPAGSCACLAGVDNYCLYPKGAANCGMTRPGGYCDPNGDGGFEDADWGKGYSEYQKACAGSPPPAPTGTTTPPPPPPPPASCACLTGVDNYCLYPKGTANCGMTMPGGYCDPNGDGGFDDADWVRGYSEYQKACPGGGSPPPPPPPSPCACKGGVDNFCLYGPNVAGCAMTTPGGYCDPNGDGSFADADWVKGYDEYHQACP